MKYRPRRSNPLGAKELAVFTDFGLSEKFARLLFTRGIDSKEKIKQFFDISPNYLHDPFLLKGMREATVRIEQAIARKERILLIGDYDADGICSVAIMYKYLCSRHASTRYFLPDRSDDGYGLNIDLIDKLNERFEPKLIITVDCGISCTAEVDHAKSLGIDCIVTDHHVIPEKTPNCICVNPKFADQKYPFRDLCGAGVALKVVHALGGLETARKYLDICSIATVADIVALKDENRIITSLGLQKLNANSLPSITALAKSCNIHGDIKSSDISFKLGPKINASGRMGNAKRGLDIILEQNEAEIDKIIKHLADYNLRRQKLCNTIYQEVEAQVEHEKLYKNNIIVLADKKWESGVLGIVSARITEKYGKPSIIFGIKENVAKGSGRSIDGIDIVRTVEKFSDMLISFGGHAMAAGLSVAVDRFDEFNKKITDHMNESYNKVNLTSEKLYDFDLEQDEITPQFLSEIEKLEPTGCDNPSAVFMMTVTNCQVGALTNHPIHLRFSHKNMQFIFFNGSACGDVLAYNFPKKVLFEFQKPDGTTIPKAVAKTVIPIPTDAKSYALTLSGYLQDAFPYEPDIKFNKILQSLNADREVFVDYYKFIKTAHGTRAFNVYDLFMKLETLANSCQYNLHQFIFCATVFRQLGILVFNSGVVSIDNAHPTDLFLSPAYNKVREQKVDIEIKIGKNVTA
ncbi:MAG: single-stranded-DNA-specific exonuclease RecJ [Christensenellaceae bacterium]|jgi:single-stranded-DNA-specific exonuclease RecJ|nr:single-stranded-DNA-specific exonuclease RecJ [Christensenellaceae bacterium]